MCPDPQLISIYLDGELPSPWKEKMETHLAKCSCCRERLENFRQLHELFKKDTHIKRIYVEREAAQPSGAAENADSGEEDDDDTERGMAEQELIEAAKDRVWRKFDSGRRLRQRDGLWQRRLSIPLPAAAAAAVILAVLAMLWLRGGFLNQSAEPAMRANFILAEEEEMPGIIPVDMNGVLQYLTSDDSEIIILRLPESRNFFRTGEPAIINASDYKGRRP